MAGPATFFREGGRDGHASARPDGQEPGRRLQATAAGDGGRATGGQLRKAERNAPTKAAAES